ncbi:MAG: hypothetical protein DRH90_19780 [Deltaproteobacteria bacterium]|nr:MAG: hypothetical protein DRH90_19780 [Deltaproteobacteria bacterium]RLC15865.1 MAG: hypothetical protein DRI24_09815 [Deltaproteobacteria bacterium]
MKKIARVNKTYVSAIMIILLVMGVALEAWAYERISSKKNSVKVDVVPVQLASGQQVKFDIRMSTHSVELGQDMEAVSLLKDSNGQVYRTEGWKGSPPGGHHRSGTLEFPAIKGNPGSVTLIIKNIASVPQRVFTWNVKE